MAWKTIKIRDSEIMGLKQRLRSLEDMAKNTEQRLVISKETVEKIEENPVNTENQENELDRWLGNIAQLRNFIKRHPEYAIPEFKFLTTKDWLAVTEGQLENEADYRRALAGLREKAKTKVVNELRQIIENFPKINDGNKPRGMEDIIKYLPEDFDSSIIERYITNTSGQRTKGGDSGWIIKEAYRVDDIWESEFALADNGGMIMKKSGSSEKIVQAAINEYTVKNSRAPTKFGEISSYINNQGNSSDAEKANQIFNAIMTKIK